MKTHSSGNIKISHCVMVLMCCSYSVAAQIDYLPHPDFISASNRALTVYWINASPEKCLIDLNHFVEFHNVKGDILTASKVQVVLYKNENPVKSYLFSTGSGILNRLYVPEPVPLKKGDALYFVFTLLPETDNEEYVFNIFQKKEAPTSLALGGEQKMITYAPLSQPETDHSPQPINTPALTAAKKPRTTRQKYGGALKQEMRKERFNRTMTNVVGILDFLL